MKARGEEQKGGKVSRTKPCLRTKERDPAPLRCNAWRFANYSHPVRTIALYPRNGNEEKKAAGVDRTKTERGREKERRSRWIGNRSFARIDETGFIGFDTQDDNGEKKRADWRGGRGENGERKRAILSIDIFFFPYSPTYH